MKKSSLYVRRITISAAFLSIALVLRTMFTFEVPLFGQNGMRIGISDIFSFMPALLFGPIYGMIVSGIYDILGFIIKPTGPFIPLMTITAICGGFIRGALWSALGHRSSKKMRIIVTICSVLLLLVGICNIIFLSSDGIHAGFYKTIPKEEINTENMHLVSKMLISRTIDTKNPSGNLATYILFMTTGVMGSAILGIVLLFADFFISKKFLKDTQKGQVPQLLIVLLVSGLIVTTLNTFVLREVFSSWKLLPFSVIWIPRLIEEILSNTIYTYFMAMLLGVLRRQRGLQELITTPTSTKGY